MNYELRNSKTMRAKAPAPRYATIQMAIVAGLKDKEEAAIWGIREHRIMGEILRPPRKGARLAFFLNSHL